MRWSLAVLACAAVLGVSSPAQAATCGSGGYSYAGLAAPTHAFGIGATVTPLATFSISTGHVAGWVGVGGPGQGPNGTDEWIQVGFSAFPDWLGNDLYYEVARPGAAPVYSRLRAALQPGQQMRVSVLEMSGRGNWWRVWVNGAPASAPIHLPQSDRRWRPVVTAESWDAGLDVCNEFGYRFNGVRVALAPGGAWSPLAAATPIAGSQARLVRLSKVSFVAAAGPLARRLLSAAG